MSYDTFALDNRVNPHYIPPMRGPGMNTIKMIVVVLLMVLAQSCMTMQPTSPNPMGIEDVPSFTNPEDINMWVFSNIYYDGKGHSGYAEIDPMTVLSEGKGTCLEYSVLFRWLCARNGIEGGSLVYVRIVDEEGTWLHVLARLDGIYYDPTQGKVWGTELPDGWTRISRSGK